MEFQYNARALIVLIGGGSRVLGSDSDRAPAHQSRDIRVAGSRVVGLDSEQRGPYRGLMGLEEQ